MQIEMRAVASIIPYENNPRINDAAVDAVAASIREFGFRQPIVLDEQSVIIVGDTRFKAALKLGMTEVPVHVAAGLGVMNPFGGAGKKLSPQGTVEGPVKSLHQDGQATHGDRIVPLQGQGHE